MKGAIARNNALAQTPRYGNPGINPTSTTPTRRTSIAAIEMCSDLRMPSQSV